MDTKGEKMKYKYSRKQIAEEFVYKSDSVNGASLLGMLQALADKPKEECKHENLEGDGESYTNCLDCGASMDTPLKSKPEIERIDWNGFLCKPDWRKFDEITGAINNLVDRVNLLSTEGKEGK